MITAGPCPKPSLSKAAPNFDGTYGLGFPARATAVGRGDESRQMAVNKGGDRRLTGITNSDDGLRASSFADRLSRLDPSATCGIDAVRDSSAQLREKATQVSDATAGRVRDEPLKAVLIAAAAGAGLMALVVLASRSGNRD